MPLDADALDRALALSPSLLAGLRRDWGEVIDLAVWSTLDSGRLGAVPRLRKRALQVGERIAALGASRAWIPHSRERAKSALASALAAVEAIEQFETESGALKPGAERDTLMAAFGKLRESADQPLRDYAERCARLLEAVTQEEN